MKKFLSVCAVVALSVSLAACGSNEETGSNAGITTSTPGSEPKKDPVEIVLEHIVTPNLTMEFWDSIVKNFETANPSIKVKRIQPPSGTEPGTHLKTLLAAGDLPDVMMNAPAAEFVQAGILKEFPIDDDIKKVKNYEAQSIGGKLYNLNAYVQPHSLIFYNKKLFADAGITAPPKTWDEFVKVAEQLKAKGITPLLTSGEWVTGFTMNILSSPEIFGNNPRWLADRLAGKVHYTDPVWVETATRFQDLVKKGYFNKGALSIGYTQLEQEFLKGNGAMYPMGVWFTASAKDAKFDIGVFAAPSKDGNIRLAGSVNGGGMSVAQNSKHPEEAMKLAKYLVLDPDVHKQFLIKDGLLSNLTEPITVETTPLQKEVEAIIKNAKIMTGTATIATGDSIPAAGITDEFTIFGQNLFAGGDVVKELEKLDKIADKAVKK